MSAESDGPDILVQADVQRLKQVLLNLLSNAVKYNNAGGHVRVRSAHVRNELGRGMAFTIELEAWPTMAAAAAEPSAAA